MKCTEFLSFATKAEATKPIIKEALDMHASGDIQRRLLAFPSGGSYVTC